MADIKKVFGVQFVLENTKSVLNDTDKFIGQMEKKVEKIDLTSEIKTEFSELINYLNENFKNGLNLSSQFSDIIDSEDANEAIKKIRELLDNLILVNEILEQGSRNSKSSRTKLGALSSYQIDNVFQIAKDQKANATANTRQANVMREINDAYKKTSKASSKDLQSDVGQAVGMSKELEDIIKNIANDIKNIRSTVNGFKQNGIKSTMAGITSEMVAQGEAGTNLNEVLLNLIASLGTYKEIARGGINPSKNKSGKTDTPKTEEQEKKDDPIHDALQDYDELDKLLIRYSNKEGFFNTFKRHGKDIVSVIDKLRETKIALEDIEAEYPRLVAGYKLWVDIQNTKKDTTKKKINGLYEQRLNEEKKFYQENEEVGKGLRKEENFKTIQANYQLKINSLQGQIDEELSKALEEGLMTQAEVDQAKSNYAKKLEEATAEIDTLINEQIKKNPLIKLSTYMEEEEKVFKKKDPKAYREYRESIQPDIDEIIQQVNDKNISLDKKTKRFLNTKAEGREAVLIRDNILQKVQDELTKTGKSSEEIRQAYSESSEIIIEAQQRLQELQNNVPQIVDGILKKFSLLFNQEDFFKKYAPNENQIKIDEVKDKLYQYSTQLQTTVNNKDGSIKYDSMDVESYKSKYSELRPKIEKLINDLKTLGASEEEISKLLTKTVLDEKYWIEQIKDSNAERKRKPKGEETTGSTRRNGETGQFANTYAGADYSGQRNVEDEDSYKTNIGDNSEQYSEEKEQLEQLISTLEKYKEILSTTNSVEEYSSQFDSLQKEIKETEQQYRSLYESLRDSDIPIASWEEIQPKYFDNDKLEKAKRIKEWKELQDRMDNADKEAEEDAIKSWERYNERIRKEAERKSQIGQVDIQPSEDHAQALEREQKAREGASEASSQVDTSVEVSETEEATEVIHDKIDALDELQRKQNEVHNNNNDNNNNRRLRGNIIVSTPSSASTSTFTMSDDGVGTMTQPPITPPKKEKTSKAKYRIGTFEIPKINIEGIEQGIVKTIITRLNTSLGKYSELLGVIPENEEAKAEVEEFHKAQQTINGYRNTVANMGLKTIDSNTTALKIVELYDEASNLASQINNKEGTPKELEKAEDKLNNIKSQIVALLSVFSELGSIEKKENNKKTVIRPLDFLKEKFQNQIKDNEQDVAQKTENFLQWLNPLIAEKDKTWLIGKNIKNIGENYTDSHGRTIQNLQQSKSSNYANNSGLPFARDLSTYFKESTMGFSLNQKEIKQISDLFPMAPLAIGQRYLKENINSEEIFAKIQTIIANAIQNQIDIVEQQIANGKTIKGKDLDLTLTVLKKNLSQLYKSMGISVENSKPVVAPVTQPVSSSQQPPSAPTAQQPTDNAGQAASETSGELKKEGDEVGLVGVNFQNAALAKKAFTEANKEAKASAEETAIAIGEETNEAGQVANEFDLVAEKTREAVAKIINENQKTLKPREVLSNLPNLAEQIENITQGKLPSAQGLGEGFYKLQSEKYHRTIDEMDFNGILTLFNSLEVQTDSLLKLLSQVGIVGSEGFTELVTSMKQVEQTITSTDNEVNNLYRTFNNTKIKGISKLSETQLMGKADNSLLEMERLYNEDKQGTNDYLLEQLKVKQVLDEMIKRSGGRSGLGVDNDFDAYNFILNKWIKSGSLVSDKKAVSLFPYDFINIGDETGKAYGAKKAIEEWVRPSDYQNMVLMGQQFGIILDYITQNQEALKLVHDQLQANLSVIEETSNETKGITTNSENSANNIGENGVLIHTETKSDITQDKGSFQNDDNFIKEFSESLVVLKDRLSAISQVLDEIINKKEQLGQTIAKAETSAQSLSPEQTASTTSELEETKNKVIELERQIANLQNQAQKFDFGDKAIETLKEFEKILKAISESLKDIDAKWKGIYATNASDFKKAIAEESQKSDIKSNSPTKTTNDIIKDQLKSDLIALTNKSSKTGIYGRDSLHIKDRANKLSDPKDIDNLEKADALFDKIAKRIQNLKKSKSLSGILDDPEIKALLEERRKQINYVSRSKLKKNANENNLRQNRNASKLEQAYKSATELAPEAYRIEDLVVNGTASDKDLKKFNDFVRAKNYIESEEGQKVQSLIDSNVIKNYQTAISFSEQRQEALRKEREELEKKAEAEKRAQEYEALKARMDKAELDDEWDAKHSIERYNQQVKKENAKRTAELWARMDADEESKNQDYKQSQENYKKQLAYSEKVRQEKEAQEQKDIEAIVKAYDIMTTKARTYYELRDRQESGEDLTAKEKDRLEQLEKEYQEATNTLIEYGKNKTELWDKEPVMNAEQAFLDKNMLVNEELNAKRQEKDIQTIINAYNLLSDKMRQYYTLKEKEATGEISNSEKDKLEQLEKQYQSTLAVLIDFAREKEALWQDNRIIEAEQGFLNKEKQVKGEQVDKQTRQQNLETQAKEIQDRKDGQELINTYKQLYDVYYKYQQLKEKQNNVKTPLSSVELKQIQDLEAELDKLNSKLLEFANNKPELWNQKNVVDAEETFKNNILNIDSIGNGDKVKQIVNAYDKQFSAEDKIRSLTVQQASNYNANRAKQIADLEAKVKEYTQIINENTKAIMDNNDAVALNIVNSAKQQYNQKTESSTNVLNESINTDRINKAKSTLASLEELRSEYSSGNYTNQQELLDAVETRINNINQLIKDLNTNPLDLTTKEDLDELSQIDKELSNYKKDIADIKKDSKDYQTANGSKTARSIAEFMAKNSGISQEAKDALQQYINLIDKGVNVGQLREIGAAFENIKRQEIEAGRTGTTFFDMLGQRVKGLTATLMTYVSFWRIFSELKQGFQIIHQFDDALAEMQKVSNETLDTLREFQGTSFDLADSIGSDALALQQSVAEFMRLGQSLEEATDSAKSANILLNVSEFTSASEASEALIAMSQAYQDLSNIEIIDVINKLGNDFPISTQGLATALQDGAASLTTAGNSFYEAAALVTAGNRITQDPSKVGKAMRTIALRLTGTEASKAELEEDGEEVEGMITNVSKLRDVIMQATKVSSNGFKGFDILKDNGAYKSTYEILLGIADIYDEIVENDEKYGTKGANLLLETIAGKNRASVAASILQSPEMLKNAYAEAIDAEGSAEIENAKFVDSISGHLEELKNAWQEVWANTLNRDVINFFLDLGTAILKVVSNIGLIPSLLIAGGGIATLYEFAKNDGIIVQGLHALNDALTANTVIKEANTVATEQETKANIENTGSQVAETTADAADTAQTMAQAAATEANVAATKQETAENLKNAASQGVKEGSKKTSIGANLATNFSLLKETASNAFTAIGGIKGILGGGLVIGGIVAAIQAYDALNVSATETAKEAKEISSAFEESLGTIQKHKDSVNELSEAYQKLSTGVNTATNANLTLSNDEYSQYLDICNKIADLYPQLVSGYDLQGNAIINLTDNVKDLRDALIEEQKVAANTFLQGGEKKGIGGFFDNLFGFFGLGNKNSIKDNFNNNYDKYNDIQTIQDQFLNKNNVSLDDYTLFRTDLLGKSLDGDIEATNLLTTLDEISNGLVDSDEKLQTFLNNLKDMDISPEMQQSIKQAQQTILSEFSLNDDYWDLIYNNDKQISQNASNLFTNIINGLSPEQLNKLMTSSESLENITANIVQTVNNLLTDTSNNRINWSEILNTKDLNNAIDGYQDSFNKLHELGYTDQAILSMADIGKVGNVNLNTDRAIQWNEDNLNKYISQLRGWNEGLSDEEIKNKFKNETSTVFGSGDTFDFGKGTIDLSFATITEDGRLLDIDELYDYIQTILTRAEHSGEPLTIDTVLKFDAQGITDKNGNTIKNMIAGEGFNASEAMHEIELLKGYGDTTGFIDILHQYKDEYGSFITDILQMSGDARSGLQKITNFQDILKDIDNYNVGEGILANANMGDFTKLTALYKKSFAEAFADSGINGEDLFNSMFTDKSVLELNDRFTEVLQTSSVTAMNREAREQAKELFSTLSQDEADAFLQAFNGAKNFEEVLNNYHNNLRALASGAYEAVVNIEDATAAVNTLTSALSSSASGNGLSEEEITNIRTLFQDVVGFDENKLLENTANGVHLNVEELERLNKEYTDFNIKKQSKQLDYYNEKLEESSKELDRLNDEWKNAKNADDKQRYADLYKGEQTVRQGIEDNINALQREIAQYASLTSAYNKYVQAQSSVNENARYENIGSGYDTTKDLIERGWIGQDDVRAYLNMFTQDDMMTASSEKLYEVWDKINGKVNSAGYAYKDFFTYDENGKSTSDGIFNFLDTVKQAAKDAGEYSDETLNKLVSKDKEGNYSFDFDVIGGDNKIADLLGVDLSLIQAIIQAARDAGFEVQMTEALPGLESLTDKIRNARDRLKELGLSAKEIDKYKVDLSLDFSNAENYESATKTLLDSIDEIKNSDMSPEVKDASLDYVNGQLDAIIAKKAILSLPTALSYDTSEVETGFQSLYASMQNYWLLQNELTQRKTLGLDTSKNEADLKAMTKDIFGLLKAMDETDREELGFGDIDFTADTEKILSQIEEKLKEEDLELHIPTTLDDPNGNPTKGIDSQKITIDIQFGVDGKTLVLKDITSVQQAADNLDGTNANVDATANTAQAEEGLAGVAEEKKKVEGPFEIEGKGKNIGPLQSAVKNARAEARDKSFTITALSSGFSGIIDFFKNIYNKITNKSVTITTNYATTGGGGNVGGGKRAVPLNGSGYNGTAHALGTAYAKGTSGNWGVSEDQDALTGELGEELVVRNGHFFTVGSESAEMVHLQKGDIVFNADQTKQIFEKGRIINGSRRGRAHVDGTAYSAGSGGRRRTNAVVANSKTSNNSSSNNNNKSNNKKSSNNNKEGEKMDWIAIAIERIEQQIDELNDVVDSVYRSWSDRNQALAEEIKAVSDEIAIQQAGYKRYLKEAESVGLSAAYAKKVREGTIDIEKITDENLKKKIDEYQQWYKAAEDCRVKIAELEETENELYQKKIDNIIARYEAISNKYQDQISSINALMDLAEEQGLKSSSEYYKALQDWEQKNYKALNEERQKAFEQLQDNIAEGMIIRGSEAWLEAVSNIDQITESIINSQKALVEYNNEIRQIKWDNFDLGQERIKKVTDEVEFMIDTISNEDLFDEKGTYTAQGLASQALHIANLEAYTKQSEEYAEAIEEARDAIVQDPYNQELIDRYYELIEAQQDAISNIYSEKDAIKDLIQNGIDKELESLQKLIDKYKDAISSQSDLLSYQDNVTDQAEEIAKIQKQIAAYSGDNSEESRLKVQQLQQSLKDAQKALSDTQREHNESDITESLDSLYEQYEELLDEKLKDTDTLISEVTAQVNANGSDIRNAILESANKVDYTLTEALDNIISIADGDTIATKIGETIAGILQNVINTNANSDTNAKNKLNDTPLGVEDYGWQTDSNGNMQYREFGSNDVLKGGMHDVNGKTYYFDEQGNMTTGFIKNGKDTYYFDENTRRMASGLTDIEGLNYYFDPKTNKMQTGNVTIDGKDYYFSKQTGKQLFGIREVDGNKYFYSSSAGGAKTTGLQTIDGQKYYFDPTTGQMVYGLQTVGKDKYYFDDTEGYAIKGFKDVDGQTYYFKNANGIALVSNWLDYKTGNKIYRYRFDAQGHAIKGKSAKVGKTTYYFNNEGKLLTKKNGSAKTFSKKSYSYATGAYKIGSDREAWTQEYGKTEAIIRPSDGAVLTPIVKNDSVLDPVATKNMFAFFNNPTDFFKQFTDGSNYETIPNNIVNNTVGDINVTFNIAGSNITDFQTFMTECKNSPQFEKMVRAMTVDRMFGGSALKKFKV